MASPSQDPAIDDVFRRLQGVYASLSSAKSPFEAMKSKALLRTTALELASSVQQPHEAATAFAMSNAVHPCYRAASDCGILTKWPKETMTAQELAARTGADARLIARLMRILTASGVFTEVGEEKYSHNGLSSTLSIPAFLGMVKFTSPGVAKLPEYLAATSYTNPGSIPGTATPFQYGNNTPLGFYQALAKDSKARAGFDDQMKRHVLMERAKSQTGFASMYDFRGEIGALITSSEEVALVDVGGSQGHVLEDVRKHLPDLKGRLILEELPETLESVQVPEGVEAVPYNFLESVQPIKGGPFSSITGNYNTNQLNRSCMLSIQTNLLELERREWKANPEKHTSSTEEGPFSTSDYGAHSSASWGAASSGIDGYTDDADGGRIKNRETVEGVPGRGWF
ncbi:uncharacterized protein PAC_16210 [Phialocephala subalpina]|uniref:O-methyltransferase dimerisation domain-containing protein n=1 Tax=Phialocephala subalpina TaxID=576137 RepID=A0A1L7XMQ1_9HELO|nr:uncharacterized protein PAC_16210 [Phialocephala subalpina]